jgi:hypothetical protein
MVGGSLQVLWLLPPLKLVAMILLKVALKQTKIKNNQQLRDDISSMLSRCCQLKVDL